MTGGMAAELKTERVSLWSRAIHIDAILTKRTIKVGLFALELALDLGASFDFGSLHVYAESGSTFEK
jgi:hypothetical protein